MFDNTLLAMIYTHLDDRRTEKAMLVISKEFNNSHQLENARKEVADRRGEHHRRDGPAVVKENGDREWWLDGKRHRVGGPAIEETNGYKEWWLNGKIHREDSPAIEWPDGDKSWYLNGKRYR